MAGAAHPMHAGVVNEESKGTVMADQELLNEIRKAVRRYAEGIRKAEDIGSQLAYEDGLVNWVYGRIANASK